MIFRQLFDHESYTYTYLLADEVSRETVLIDPVIEHVSLYVQLLREMKLELKYAIDTHTHADHVTASGLLREQTKCLTVLGYESDSTCVSQKVIDGERLSLGEYRIQAIHTPGHTNDSYSFVIDADGITRLFTGDTLLIRGSGRTDFQQGDAIQQYHSIFDKLLPLGDDVRVYPGHDYRGLTESTIAEERENNPRLQVNSAEEYQSIMNALDLPTPKLMDVAVPLNQGCGME